VDDYCRYRVVYSYTENEEPEVIDHFDFEWQAETYVAQLCQEQKRRGEIVHKQDNGFCVEGNRFMSWVEILDCQDEYYQEDFFAHYRRV